MRLRLKRVPRELRRVYVPDIEACRAHDEKVLFSAHPATFHVWVGTIDGQVCSFCGRIRDWTEPMQRPASLQDEDFPLFLTLPRVGGEAA